jgi:rhodanese-related sulfurtransferase
MRLLFALALACSVLVGCSKSSKDATETKAAAVPAITVDELDQALAKESCQAVDANGTETRKKMGVIPGAILLTDSESFTPSELPADKSKPLVFYCANTHCGASHQAAEKALTAGYTNVKVLPEGIAGWVKANKKTSSI